MVSVRRILLVAVLAALLLVPAAQAWTWPANGVVLQAFLFDPAHPYAAGQHRGIAIGGDAGAAVLAPASGTVTFAGTVPSSGKSVTIATVDGLAVTLTHLGSISVARGATVGEGDAIGTVAATGDAEIPQPYVHLGIRVAANQQGYLDPLSFLPARVPVPPAIVAPAPIEPAPAPVPGAEPQPEPAAQPETTAQPEAAAQPAAAAQPEVAAQPAVTAQPEATPQPGPVAQTRPVPVQEPAVVASDAANPARPVGASVDPVPAPLLADPVVPPEAAPDPVVAAIPVAAPVAVTEPEVAPPPAVPEPVGAAPAEPARPAESEPSQPVDVVPGAAQPETGAARSVVEASPDPTASEADEHVAATPAHPARGAGRAPADATSTSARDTAARAHSASPTPATTTPASYRGVSSARRAGLDPRVVTGAVERRAADASPRTRSRHVAADARPHRDVVNARTTATAALRHATSSSVTILALLAILALPAVAALVGLLGAVRMMVRNGGGTRQEADPRCAGVAVRGGAPALGAHRGLRRPVRRVRPLPPAAGERRPHGEWDGRARHAGDGGRRPGREVVR